MSLKRSIIWLSSICRFACTERNRRAWVAIVGVVNDSTDGYASERCGDVNAWLRLPLGYPLNTIRLNPPPRIPPAQPPTVAMAAHRECCDAGGRGSDQGKARERNAMQDELEQIGHGLFYLPAGKGDRVATNRMGAHEAHPSNEICPNQDRSPGVPVKPASNRMAALLPQLAGAAARLPVPATRPFSNLAARVVFLESLNVISKSGPVW
jgi:hypothetical protein